MCSRRNKGTMQAFLVILVLAIGSGAIYFYHHMNLKLSNSARLLDSYRKQHASLQSQLKVVYDHRAKLEKSLQKEKAEHKKTKEEKEESQQEHEILLTRTKHEATNRFNALDTEHKMISAKYESLDVEHKRLQQQHLRAVQDHQNTLDALHQNMAKIRQEAEHAKQWWYDSYNKMSQKKIKLEESVKTYQNQLLKRNNEAEAFSKKQNEYIGRLTAQIQELKRQVDLHKDEAMKLNSQLKEMKKASQDVKKEQVKTHPPQVPPKNPTVAKTEPQTAKTKVKADDGLSRENILMRNQPPEPPRHEETPEQDKVQALPPTVPLHDHDQTIRNVPVAVQNIVQQQPQVPVRGLAQDLGFEQEQELEVPGQAGDAGFDIQPDVSRIKQDNTNMNEEEVEDDVLQEDNMHKARREYMQDQNRMEMEMERENYNGQDPPISDQDQRTAGHPDLVDRGDEVKEWKNPINTDHEAAGGAGRNENAVRPLDHLAHQQTDAKVLNADERDADTEQTTKHDHQRTKRSVYGKNPSKSKKSSKKRKKKSV